MILHLRHVIGNDRRTFKSDQLGHNDSIADFRPGQDFDRPPDHGGRQDDPIDGTGDFRMAADDIDLLLPGRCPGLSDYFNDLIFCDIDRC